MVTTPSPPQSLFHSICSLGYEPIKIKISARPKTFLKPLALSNCLSTSFNYDHEFQEKERLKLSDLNYKNHENFGPPIAIRYSGTVWRCFWDGKDWKLVSVEGIHDVSVNSEDGLSKLGIATRNAVRNFFLPREVGSNYLDYVKWKFLHRVFSSALQVLATQAMFRAMGIGYSRSLPSAAALNWVLKDGLGRLSRCIYTATFASAFDTNLKRVNFSTSVMFSLSIGFELLTSVFPKYFLLLATVANIAKQISLACHLATGPAVQRSFAVADNLGEVSAKAQIQTVCFDIVGLLVAATLNILCKNNHRYLTALPFVVYPIFSTLDLFGIYQGLKHVHLQTLTKDTLETIINIWIKAEYVPSPAEVSKREGVNLFVSKGRDLLPIRIGSLNPKRKVSKLSLMTLGSLSQEDVYFICLEMLNSGSTVEKHGILLCFREGATTADIILGLLQVGYLRKSLLPNTIGSKNGLEVGDSSSTALRKWFVLMKETNVSAKDHLHPLIDKMIEVGWACKSILLSREEQARYSFVADRKHW